MPNLIITNQAINLIAYESETLELPISIFADRQGLFVKLMATQLTSLVSNGENQRLVSKDNILSYVLGYQQEFNSTSQYACLIPHYQLKQGTYTGNIIIKNNPSNGFDTPDTNPILSLIPVNIQILAHPLNEVTKWSKPNSNDKYTTKEMLVSLYEFIYLRAAYYTKNLDESYALNYRLTDNKTKVLTFRTDTMEQLPFGAKCFVKSKVGTIIRQFGVFNSGLTGYSEEGTGWQISQDNTPLSYSLVETSDLAIGEYVYWAEYVSFGKTVQTSWREFRIG